MSDDVEYVQFDRGTLSYDNVPTFLMYQERAIDTAVYPGSGAILGLLYASLGLAGEGGEVANVVKKLLRDGLDAELEDTPEQLIETANYDIEFRKKVAKELGDVLWYVAQVCNELGLEMATVAEDNLKKLADRKDRGVLKGSGDNR